MNKNFDLWNTRKKLINSFDFKGYIHEREIWWSSLGLNIGDEQDGKNELFERPVLIIKKFNRDVALIVPLTSSVKENKYYFSFRHQNILFAAIVSQLRLISTKRLSRKIRKIDHGLFSEIKKRIIEVCICP